jgi:shikimate dehydrogenase
VIPYLHALDPTAQAVGAVNCIRIRNSLLTGFNTDIIGFEQSLQRAIAHQPPLESTQALILGTGGAAKAVAWVLKNMDIPFLFVSRQPVGEQQISYEAIATFSPATYRILINATPLGTYPGVNNCPPIPFDWLQPEHLVYDLIYNPPETLLLRHAAERGCMVKNGLEMLHLQAEAAWSIWSDQ